MKVDRLWRSTVSIHYIWSFRSTLVGFITDPNQPRSMNASLRHDTVLFVVVAVTCSSVAEWEMSSYSLSVAWLDTRVHIVTQVSTCVETMSVVRVLVSLPLLAMVVTGDRPMVRIADGYLRGDYKTSTKGRQFAAFKGIPFAKPPVGSLRFKVRLLKWQLIIPKDSQNKTKSQHDHKKIFKC